jgi:hypothetical protein
VASGAGSSPASGGLCPSQAARAARLRPPTAGALRLGTWRGRRQRRAGGSARDQQDPNLPFNPSSFAPLRLCASHKNFFAQRRKDAKFFRIKRSRFEARRHLGAYPIPDFPPSVLRPPSSVLFQSKIQNPKSKIINLFLSLSHPKFKIQNSKFKIAPLLLSPVS